MTAHTPQLDSEELHRKIHELCLAFKEEQGPGWIDRAMAHVDEIMQLIQADRAAFADRVLAVLPEKRKYTQFGSPTFDRDKDNKTEGFNECRDQVTTAITNLVAEGRGEKKT